MKIVVTTTIALMLSSGGASAAIYQCQVNEQTVFSDTKCGKDAKEVEAEAAVIGGQLDTNSDVETYQSARSQRNSSSQSDCPYIDSTRLNKLKIRKTLARGMTRSQVRSIWGSPSSISDGSGTTQWAYHWENGNSNYVYFEDGCVQRFSSYRN